MISFSTNNRVCRASNEKKMEERERERKKENSLPSFSHLKVDNRTFSIEKGKKM